MGQSPSIAQGTRARVQTKEAYFPSKPHSSAHYDYDDSLKDDSTSTTRSTTASRSTFNVSSVTTGSIYGNDNASLLSSDGSNSCSTQRSTYSSNSTSRRGRLTRTGVGPISQYPTQYRRQLQTIHAVGGTPSVLNQMGDPYAIPSHKATPGAILHRHHAPPQVHGIGAVVEARADMTLHNNSNHSNNSVHSLVTAPHTRPNMNPCLREQIGRQLLHQAQSQPHAQLHRDYFVTPVHNNQNHSHYPYLCAHHPAQDSTSLPGSYAADTGIHRSQSSASVASQHQYHQQQPVILDYHLMNKIMNHDDESLPPPVHETERKMAQFVRQQQKITSSPVSLPTKRSAVYQQQLQLQQLQQQQMQKQQKQQEQQQQQQQQQQRYKNRDKHNNHNFNNDNDDTIDDDESPTATTTATTSDESASTDDDDAEYLARLYELRTWNMYKLITDSRQYQKYQHHLRQHRQDSLNHRSLNVAATNSYDKDQSKAENSASSQMIFAMDME